MSCLNRLNSPIPFILLILLILVTQMACSGNSQESVLDTTDTFFQVDQSLEVPNDLVFAGQVSDNDGNWMNNYVIVLFKNGVEIARTHTKLYDAQLSGQGPMDGVFELRISNEYKLTTAHDFLLNGRTLTMRPINTVKGQAYIGTWFNIVPESYQVIDVPAKQLTYELVVLEMPLDELPVDYQPGNLSFDEIDVKLVVNQQEIQQELVIEHVEEMETPVPVPTAEIIVQTVSSNGNETAVQSSAQLTTVSSQSNGQGWHMQLTGFYGTRWEVWETYVAGRGSHMSWETFKEAVLAHNPQLEADGYVFYPDQAYLLPDSE